jgi:hypothetical protein
MGALATRLGAPGWAGNKLGSAGDKSGSTFNHRKAVWEKPFFFLGTLLVRLQIIATTNHSRGF